MKTAPQIGQTVYSLNVGNSAGRRTEQKLTPMTVVSVKRKYFSCCREGEQFNPYRFETFFHLENWREKTEFCCNHHLYASPQEWEDENETSAICEMLRRTFEYGGNPKGITLETLRKIKALIHPTPQETEPV